MRGLQAGPKCLRSVCGLLSVSRSDDGSSMGPGAGKDGAAEAGADGSKEGKTVGRKLMLVL